MPVQYLSKRGALFVHGGIGGNNWSTYYRTGPRSLKRLKVMPVRATREEAERDLAGYAQAHRLPAYPLPGDGAADYKSAPQDGKRDAGGMTVDCAESG